MRSLSPVSWLLALLVVLTPAAPVFADTTAQFWDELGGSASGNGLSNATNGVPTGNRHVSVAIGPDGRPVVAWVDGDTIKLSRWTGTAWQLIGPAGPSGGLPQIVIDPNGRMYLAWRQFAGSTLSWEVFLLARDYDGGAWEQLGGSASGGGISGAEGASSVPAFSLALGPDGTPYVAYETSAAQGDDFNTVATGILQGSHQIYVRRWAGPADGWVFVGSGREDGGASNVYSFRIDGPPQNFARHDAEHPALAIDADGNPLVAFIYVTHFSNGNPPEFANNENDDIYVTRWNGAAWEALGPAVPSAPTGAGLGAPGGISNTPGWSRETIHDRLVRPSLIVARDGTPVVAWGETTEADGFRRIYVERWNGSAWEGMGSASGEIDMIAYAYDTSLAAGADGPIIAWPRGGGEESWVFVLAWNPVDGHWRQIGEGSASGTGISGPGNGAFNPRVAVGAAGIPTVAWIDTTPAKPQAFLRTFNERQLSDLSVTSVTAPSSATFDVPFPVTAIVRNGGTAPSASTVLRIYLATSTTHTAGDTLLGSDTIPDLAIGAGVTRDFTVTVPGSMAAGNYRIIAVVDEPNAVEELNEANNARASSQVAVAPPGSPDLDITAFSAPAGAHPGDQIALQHTVQNIGNLMSGAFTLSFFLSTDDILGGDTLLGTRAVGGLAAGAGSTLTTTVTLPANTAAPATYRIIAMAAASDGVDSDTSNNGAVSDPLSVTIPQAPSEVDLTVTDITLPATVVVGRPLAIGHTVRNVGTLAAGAFTVRFYLSTDATFDSGDTLLGARTITSLPIDASNAMTSTFTVPAGIAPATYRVLIVADALEQIAEAGETNNTGVSAALAVTAVLPDLTVTELLPPATGQTGRTLAITHTVRNIGPASAGASTVRFYLSGDATLDAGDVLLGSRAVTTLASGAFSTMTTSLTVPVATAAGTYRVIAVADALGQVTETDETNNAVASAALTITLYRPDLTVTDLLPPATGQTGRPIGIRHTARNLGAAPVGASTIRFYLSADETLDAGDVLLGSRALGAFTGPGLSTTTTTVTVPVATAPGTYRVIAVADALEQHVEVDEANNTVVSAPITITLYRPDVTITTLTPAAMGQTGRPLAIPHTVRNNGPAPAGAFTVRFYLSTDDTLDAGDVLLGFRSLGSLAAATNSATTTTVTIPAATEPGTYRVIAVTDALNQQTEMDEANNTAVSAAVTITLYRPDVTITTLTPPATGQTGRPLAIPHTVRNNGPAPAGAFTVRFYLSTDGTFDAGDVLLGFRSLGSLAAATNSATTTTVTVPAATEPGTYRIIAVADALNQQTEMDEANNTAVSAAVTITLYRPDLTMTAMTMPASAAVGRPLAIAHTVRNNGPAPSGAFTVRFYLSTDDTFDAGDVVLGSRSLGSLAVGAVSTTTTTVTLPANTFAPATYRVIAVTDAMGQQIEMDENNNAMVSAVLSVTPYLPDLTVTDLILPAAGAQAGRPLGIRHTVRNIGPAPAAAFAVRFYLSADDVLDAGDVLLGTRSLTSLATGAVSATTSTFTVPANTPVPQSYRVIAVADALAQIAELSEANNVTVSSTLSMTAFAPDVRVSTVTTAAIVEPGARLSIRNVANNDGPAPASAFVVRFYLSEDGVVDDSDIVLGVRNVSGLAGYTRSVAMMSFTVPASVEAGDYQIIAVAVTPQPELDPTNNALAAPLEVAG